MKLCIACGAVLPGTLGRPELVPSDEKCDHCTRTGNTYAQNQARLSIAFDKVKPAAGWKMPINALLPATTTDAELLEIDEAVCYFTGAGITYRRRKDGAVRVRSPGYYQTIGA